MDYNNKKKDHKLEELIDLLQRPDVIKHFESKQQGPSPSDPRLNL